MSAGLVGLASLLLLALLVLLPVRPAFALLAASVVLVPDTLRLPLSDQLLVLRVAPVAFFFGLVRQVRRGDLPLAVLRPTPAVVGLVGFGVVAWAVGVMGADGGVPATFSRDAWLLVPDQLVVLVGATAAVRTIGSVRAATTVASVAVAAASIAVVERITGAGYAHRLFSWVPDQRAGGSGGRLEVRSGQVRPRVAARFSLAFAWQATMLLPVVAAVAVVARRVARTLAVGVVVAAVAFTASRSAYVGIVVGLVLAALLARRRSLLVLTGALVVAGALVGSATGLLDDAFEAPEAAGSNAIRDERAPVVLDAASADPYTGMGYGALLARGLPTTDSSWLQLYAELGAAGLAALVLSLVLALSAMAPALRGAGPGGPERMVAAGCWAGVALTFVGAGSFDLFTGRQSTLLLWVLVALGVVAGEEARASADERGRAEGPGPGARLALPALGLAVGVAVLLGAPRPAAVTVDVQLVPPAADALAAAPGAFVGRTLAHTTCEVLEAAADAADGAATCILPFGRGPGAVRLRVVGDDAESTVRVADRALEVTATRVRSLSVLERRVETASLPSPVRTAPLTGAAAGAVVAILLPGRPVRRTDGAAPPPTPARAPV